MAKSNPTGQPRMTSLPPGSLVHIGKQRADVVHVERFAYNAEAFEEIELAANDLQNLAPSKELNQWIDISGLHDVQVAEGVGQKFGVDALVLEDILNTQHRPKAEWLEDYLFVTLRMVGRHPTRNKLVIEQVSFCLGEGWLLSFQERQGDVFEGVRERLRQNLGPLRKVGPDRLFNRLVDVIVDHYYLVIDFLNQELENLETQILDHPSPEIQQAIQQLQKEVRRFRRAVFPLREAMSLILREESDLVRPETTRFMHDVYDHVVQICDQVETQREMASGLQDLYLSSIGQQNNQVMQVLTIIATIFIPLTFVAGIYGMNFSHMPELEWEYGYVTVWVVMIVLAVLMLFYFKRKRWL